MTTKFTVLREETYFAGVIKNIDGEPEEVSKTFLEQENFSSLENAWRRYNELASKDEIQKVQILVPLKEFSRVKK